MVKAQIPVSDAALAKRARTLLVVSALATLALYLVPYSFYVSYPLRLISTLFHELGHGVAAVIVGGDFERFKMWTDGSGMTYWGGPIGNAGRAFVAAGGLVGPAVVAAICLVCARRPRLARWCLGTIGALLALALVLVVRNAFGLVYVGGFAAICLFLALRTSAQTVQLGLVFLAVQLALSVYARGDYLFTQYADTAAGRAPSDVQQMADALLLPYWFWGALCAAFSAAVLIVGGWILLRGRRAPAAPAIAARVRAGAPGI
jgi:hypothetical protein